MSVFDDDLDVFLEEAITALHYPVAASGIGGFGGTPANVLGNFFSRNVIVEIEGREIIGREILFETTTARATGVTSNTDSFVIDSVKYDIDETRPDSAPGFTEFKLREFLP